MDLSRQGDRRAPRTPELTMEVVEILEKEVVVPIGYRHHDPRRGEELRCRRCGYRRRIKLRDLYAKADAAFVAGNVNLAL